MTAQQFLEQYVERYLFDDLTTMCAAERAIADNKDGHLGYPIIMACAAGIETIGVLLTNNEKDEDFENGAEGFRHYWRTYLYPSSPEDNAALGVYQLVRNGIAHNFAAKHVRVWTRAPGLHLRLDADRVPNIDATKLAGDFMDSYRWKFKPTIREHRDQIDAAFERLVAFNTAKIEPLMRKALGQLRPVQQDPPDDRFPTGSFSPGGASSSGIG